MTNRKPDPELEAIAMKAKKKNSDEQLQEEYTFALSQRIYDAQNSKSSEDECSIC